MRGSWSLPTNWSNQSDVMLTVRWHLPFVVQADVAVWVLGYLDDLGATGNLCLSLGKPPDKPVPGFTQHGSASHGCVADQRSERVAGRERHARRLPPVPTGGLGRGA